MRHDLDILRELFLPMLEEIAASSPRLADGMARGDAFWAYFNGVVLDSGEQLRELLASYGARDAAQYQEQSESLKAEYLYCLAQHYVNGQTNPTIAMLLQAGDASFAAEVDFQKDMLAAIQLAARAALKTELEHAVEFAGDDIADEDISAAFGSMQRGGARDGLRKQLKQWDEEDKIRAQPAKKKRYRTIPLLFLRFVAAAAVFTGATVGVVKVYNSKNREAAPGRHYNIGTDSAEVARPPTAKDSATGASANQPVTSGAGSSNPGSKRIDSSHAAASVAHVPQIVLKGTIVNLHTDETVTDVLVTMQDDKGVQQTAFSKDGTFRFVLPLDRDLVITGKKDKYRSARLSLSTKDVKETDADEVIEGTLRLTPD